MRAVELIAAAAMALACAVPCRSAQFDIGIVGGSLMLSTGQTVAVPDTFVTTVARRSTAGLFVAARRELGGPNSDEFRSELWLFPNPDPGKPAPTFADRRILLSLASRGGEGTRIIKRMVVCPRATAIEIEGWESATTVLFDNTGVQIDLPWDAVAEACDCEPSCKRPLTWIMFGPELPEHWELICEVGEEGGKGPYLMRYNLDSGQITVLQASEVVGEIGEAMIRHYQWGQ